MSFREETDGLSILDVGAAIRDIDEGRESIPPRRKSRDYCFVPDNAGITRHKQNHYPPKWLLSIAVKYLRIRTGHPRPERLSKANGGEFFGGRETNSKLREIFGSREDVVKACRCGGLT